MGNHRLLRVMITDLVNFWRMESDNSHGQCFCQKFYETQKVFAKDSDTPASAPL